MTNQLLYIEKNNNNAYAYEYNPLLFFFFLLPEIYVWVELERVKDSWNAQIHTHRSDNAVFLWNLSAFLLHSTLVEIFPGLYNFFGRPHKIHSHTSHKDMPASSMPPTQFTQHFFWSICVPFTLGYRCTCYATHTIYAACQRDLQVNIQHDSLTKFVMIAFKTKIPISYTLAIFVMIPSSCLIFSIRLPT